MASDEISPADRIRELSEINAEVASMMQSAGQAINSLTNKPLGKTVTGDDEDTQMTEDGRSANMEQRKEAFTENTKAYYTGLQAIVARLRRQAYALEEAGIISAETPGLSTGTQQKQASPAVAGAPTQEVERITNGGLGNLDVAWLNSRGNKVGADKEGELVQEAKDLLEEVLSRDTSNHPGE